MESAADVPTAHSQHLDSLCENRPQLRLAILDASGLGEVECAKDCENGDSRLDRGVRIIPISQQKALQGGVIELKASPGRETSP